MPSLGLFSSICFVLFHRLVFTLSYLILSYFISSLSLGSLLFSDERQKEVALDVRADWKKMGGIVKRREMIIRMYYMSKMIYFQ